MVTIKVEMELSAQLVGDVLSMAMSASDYWLSNLDDAGTLYRVFSHCDNEDNIDSILLTAEGPEAGTEHHNQTVTAERVGWAIESLVAGKVDHIPASHSVVQDILKGVMDSDSGYFDWNAADMILQVVVFGEVVYG